MTTSTHLYRQLFNQLSQHSRVCDLRHLKALAWMVSALLYSGELNLAAWEPYVVSRATKAQSSERRWQRFMDNCRIGVTAIYLPLVLAALSGWKQQRLYLVGHLPRTLPLKIVKMLATQSFQFPRLAQMTH